MEITHRGSSFAAGQGDDYYGVWSLEAGAEPIQRFPKTPEGWADAYRHFRALDRQHGVAGWRRAHPGWILLNILIGLVLWFPLLFVSGLLAAAMGAPELPEDPEGAVAAGIGITIVAGLVAWTLFVYLRRPPAVRAWILGGMLGGSVALMTILLIAR